MKITFISDTHTKHDELLWDKADLPGGDLLIHTGDIMNSGYANYEIEEFCEWFASQKQYDKKVFIAGNHDRAFENKPDQVKAILDQFPNIIYLEDELFGLYDLDTDKSVKIYGSPWQPEFYNWAFNLPRRGTELMSKWEAIHADTDILLTHGPAQGHLDTSGPPYNEPNLGCELLAERIAVLKPKIHVCGHIHGGYGYKFDGHTHFFNASILNERYEYVNKPMTVDWNPETNELIFI
jgi:Icc-related predicted phosphoesterase